MTQEAAIKWKNEIKAFQEGKQIQIFIRNEWVYDNNPSFSIKSKYRVKPESIKRLPTIEEVEKWYLENRVFIYKVANKNILHRIQSFDKREYEINHVQIGSYWHSIEDFCREYTHYDGSSLYITE